MHPDRKIGFALGILLVGIVAALFFRNEPLRTQPVSGMRRESELNRRLRDRDVSVYMGDESFTSDLNSEDSTEPEWTQSDLVEDLTRRNSTMPVPIAGSPQVVEFPEAEPLDDFSRPLPPFSTLAAEPPLVDGPRDNETTAVDSREISQLPDTPPEEAIPSPGTRDGEFDEYTVEYGDTLSGIAERFLGSPNRYSEIYDANRDRLAAPDKLRVGRSIRIPRF